MDHNEAEVDKNAVEYCKYFVDPLNIGDLIDRGISFQLNSTMHDELAGEMINELNFNDNDYEENDKNDSVMTHSLQMQLLRPFDQLREDMEKINDFMYKKIINDGSLSSNTVPLNARVGISYHAYCELNLTPFDSTYKRGVTQIFTTGADEILDGIEAAVLTMRLGEEAQFIISYKLLFREMGCPPRIKPFTDCLYVIKVKSVTLLDNENAEPKISEYEKNNFSSVIGKAKQLLSNGLILSNQHQLKEACITFEKAIHLLEFCNLKNEDEEREQVKVLIKLYTNIAVLNNTRKLPKKVCIACREIRRLTNYKPSCKVLFQEGRALIALGDYKFAEKCLRKAHSMEPNSKEIKKELSELDRRWAVFKENEKNFYMRALNVIHISNETENENKKKIKEFGNEVENIIKDLIKNNEQMFELPLGLVKEELEEVNKIAKHYKFRLKTIEMNEKTTHFIERE